LPVEPLTYSQNVVGQQSKLLVERYQRQYPTAPERGNGPAREHRVDALQVWLQTTQNEKQNRQIAARPGRHQIVPTLPGVGKCSYESHAGLRHQRRLGQKDVQQPQVEDGG